MPPDTTVDDRLVELGVELDDAVAPDEPDVVDADAPEVDRGEAPGDVVVVAVPWALPLGEVPVAPEAGISLATRTPMASDATPATPATQRDMRPTRSMARFLCRVP